MNETFIRYFGVLEQLSKVLGQLAALNQEKAATVRQKNLAALEDCMKREQALSLQLRSIDQKRDKLLNELGLHGVPLSGLEQRCPEDLRMQARKITETLRTQYGLYQSAAEAARAGLERNLHQIERANPGAENNVKPPVSLTDIRA